MQCERCTKSADTIVAEDDLTTAIHARRMLNGDEEVLKKVLERGKRLISVAETVNPEAAGTDDNIDPNATKIGMLGDHGDDAFGFLAPAQQSDEIGRLGDYRILQVLGIGGMGIVFRAEDTRLKRQVAIKVMKPTIASSRSAKDRFIREAQFTAAIEHDNIVQIYQVGEDNGVPFIAMPFLKGESLKKRLERKGRLPQADVIRIGIQVAAGLAAAHERNLIHRDIKPDNLWLEEKTGRVRILDFGLVRASSDDAGLTQSGAVMGTPRYMAPEQAMGEAIDSRCDLFSLGGVLYHLVSGKLPFEGANVTATLMAVVHQEPRPLDSVVEGIHPELVQLIGRLLAKDRNNRPAKASEVAKSLTAIHQQLKRETSKPANDEPRNGSDEMPNLLPQPVLVEPQPGKEKAPSVNATKPASTPPSGRPRKRILLAAGAGGLSLMMLGVLIYTITDKDGNKTVVRASTGTPVEFDLEPGSKLSIREKSDAATSSATSDLESQISNSSQGWHGWPADAPKPAIAPFDASEARKHQEEWAKYLNVPIEDTNTIGMQFQLIPPGEFLMGSSDSDVKSNIEEYERNNLYGKDEVSLEGPQHRVSIRKPFSIGRTEVTRSQFTQFVNATGFVTESHRDGKGGYGLKEKQWVQAPEFHWDSQRDLLKEDPDRHPVVNVSWNDAVAFCNWLSQQEKTVYRLPAEAEWEYCHRAGSIGQFGVVDDPQRINELDWVQSGPATDSWTKPVGLKKPNPFGIYGMYGNVREWCLDRFGEYSGFAMVDPVGSTGEEYVVRGGAYFASRFINRVTYRSHLAGSVSSWATGFRVVRELSSGPGSSKNQQDR